MPYAGSNGTRLKPGDRHFARFPHIVHLPVSRLIRIKNQ